MPADKKIVRKTVRKTAAAPAIAQMSPHDTSLSPDVDAASASTGTTHLANLLMQIQETISARTQKKHKQCLDKTRKEAETLINEHAALQAKHQDELSQAYEALCNELASIDDEMQALGKQLSDVIKVAETTPINIMKALHENSKEFDQAMLEHTASLQAVVDEGQELMQRILQPDSDEVNVEDHGADADESEQEDVGMDNGF